MHELLNQHPLPFPIVLYSKFIPLRIKIKHVSFRTKIIPSNKIFQTIRVEYVEEPIYIMIG